MTRPVRAALYARVSTTGHGQDVGLQLDELRQVAAQRGWDATAYVDEGVSGSKDRRPALGQIYAAESALRQGRDRATYSLSTGSLLSISGGHERCSAKNRQCDSAAARCPTVDSRRSRRTVRPSSHVRRLG
jgi:hypothetical protein